MALRLLQFVRPVVAAAVIYFLFLMVWQLAYMHKVRHWPPVQARLMQRQTMFFKRQINSGRYQAGSYGLTFVKEVFYVPADRAWVTAQDFGYLSPLKAEQQRRKREARYPVGSVMWVRINPRYPTEATTLGNDHQPAMDGTLIYVLYAAGCLCLYGLLRTLH